MPLNNEESLTARKKAGRRKAKQVESMVFWIERGSFTLLFN
jgi:hypothetical protein